MSNNEAQRLAEVVGEVADEFHHNAKNFTKGSLAQIEHHKYRDDLNAASDMLRRISELEARLSGVVRSGDYFSFTCRCGEKFSHTCNLDEGRGHE